jgi:hypothetical protein
MRFIEQQRVQRRKEKYHTFETWVAPETRALEFALRSPVDGAASLDDLLRSAVMLNFAVSWTVSVFPSSCADSGRLCGVGDVCGTGCGSCFSWLCGAGCGSCASLVATPFN